MDRKGSASVFIASARLSLLLAVQPDVLQSLADTPAFRGRGLLGRFLYALPHDLVGTGRYSDRRIDPLAQRHYHQVIRAILDLPPAATQEDPGRRHALLLEGRALAIWAEYHDAVEERQAEGGDLSGIRDWASKLAGAVARIAGGPHLVEQAGRVCPWTVPLAPETVAAAWAIGEYLIPHALAAFGQMGADPNAALARRLLRWVERTNVAEFSLRDCQQAHKHLSLDLTPALTILCQRGYLRQAAVSPVGLQGGRPRSAVYEVNPSLKTLKTASLS